VWMTSAVQRNTIGVYNGSCWCAGGKTEASCDEHYELRDLLCTVFNELRQVARQVAYFRRTQTL
jgi:hypothetical protein